MRLFRYFIFICICVFAFPLYTQADCDYARKAELNRLASNVQLSYTYDVADGVEFTLYVTNLTDDIYMVDDEGNKFTSINDFKLTYNYSKKIKYDIYSNDKNCQDEKLLSKYITLPNYNLFSALPECQQYADFALCYVFNNTTSYSETEFYDELEKYKASKETKENAGTSENWIISLFKKKETIYVIISLIGLIFILGVRKVVL